MNLQERATLIRRTIPLFDIVDALKLLSFLEKESIGILGIEGFTLEGANLIPRQDLIADFSSLFSEKNSKSSKYESLRAARIFFEPLTNLDQEVIFEFILDQD